jgi:hypothetical protein
MSDFFQNLMIYCLLIKTTQAGKVGVLGKSFGKITLLKKEPAHKYSHRDLCKQFTRCGCDSRSTGMGNQADFSASLCSKMARE